VHIADVLRRESAQRIYRCLREETPWSFLVHKDGKSADLTGLTLSDRARLAAGSWEYARDHFAFCYDHHHLSYGLEPYLQSSHYHARVVEFLNSPAFISFMRRMTGMETIAYTEAHATLYRPGDFLTTHNDHLPGKNRFAAYVLNMTPDWRAERGGSLQFLDANGNAAERYVPAFNALNVFRVPQTHRVDRVAPHAGLRYSITGWFHSL
jgi:Rps23 Pro-64 3,4-dihydroxylase Tpa1-like proline 4-hydroxylase